MTVEFLARLWTFAKLTGLVPEEAMIWQRSVQATSFS